MTSAFASNGPQPFPTSTHRRSTFGPIFWDITGRSLCEITFMPFMFTIDLRTACWGLDSLFLLKLVPFSGTESKLPCAQLWRWFSLRFDPASHIVYSFILSPKVPICVLYLGNIISHVFEDLRRTKAPNIAFMKQSKG
jgi:hypothetical protein